MKIERYFYVKEMKLYEETHIRCEVMWLSKFINEIAEKKSLNDIDLECETNNLRIEIDFCSHPRGKVDLEKFSTMIKENVEWQSSWWHYSPHWNTLTAYDGSNGVMAKLSLKKVVEGVNTVTLDWYVVETARFYFDNGGNRSMVLDELFTRMKRAGVLGPIEVPYVNYLPK